MAIYFIQAGLTGPVKIGFAKNPQRRLRYFQTGHYAPLHLLRTLEGDRRTEAWLHKHFAENHLRNEWFCFCETMMSIDPPGFEETFIDQLGGPTKLKRLLGVSTHNWNERGIPWRWRPAVVDLAKSENITIPEGFLKPERAA